MATTVQAAERRRVLAFLREGSESESQQFHHDNLPQHAKQKLWRLKRGMRTLRASIQKGTKSEQ